MYCLCHRLKITNEHHIDAQEKKSGKVNADGRCSEGKNFCGRIQENIGKQVWDKESRNKRKHADNQGGPYRKRLDSQNPFRKPCSMIAGKDRLCCLFYTFIQTGNDNGSVADDTIYTDAGVS